MSPGAGVASFFFFPRKSGGMDGSDEIVDGVVARSVVEADVVEVVDEVGVDAGVGCGEGSGP